MQKLVLVLFAVTVCALGAIIPAGLVPQPESRIVGGSNDSITSHPWQVSVQRYRVHACGGAVYSDSIVITAANCLQNIGPGNIHIRAASNNRSEGGFYTSVYRFKVHENYNPVTMENDIAVIRATSPLFTNPIVKSIELATVEPKHGELAVIAGWGAVAYGYDVTPYELHSVQVYIISRNACVTFGYGNERKILSSMLCAATVGQNFCHGDSGSSLVHNNRLVGIASWNYDCGSDNYPGVYANVAALHAWIVSTASTFP